MPIKNGDFVINTFSFDEELVALKATCAKYEDQLVIPAICADNKRAAMSVSPMTRNNDVGTRARTKDAETAAVITLNSSFIGMCWIDEASPIYTDSPSNYENDLNDFAVKAARSRKWVAACQVPGNDVTLVYNTEIGTPQENGVNIDLEEIGRPPSDAELQDRFELLLAEFAGLDPTGETQPELLILTVDVSGSMYLETIQPAYDNLKTYVTTNYPDIQIDESTFGNEAWLSLWANMISEYI